MPSFPYPQTRLKRDIFQFPSLVSLILPPPQPPSFPFSLSIHAPDPLNTHCSSKLRNPKFPDRLSSGIKSTASSGFLNGLFVRIRNSTWKPEGK